MSSVHFPSLIADLAEATAGIGSLRDPVQKSIQEYASAPNALASAQNPAQNFAIQTAINSSTILAFTAIIFGMITYFYATRDAEDVRVRYQKATPSMGPWTTFDDRFLHSFRWSRLNHLSLIFEALQFHTTRTSLSSTIVGSGYLPTHLSLDSTTRSRTNGSPGDPPGPEQARQAGAEGRRWRCALDLKESDALHLQEPQPRTEV